MPSGLLCAQLAAYIHESGNDNSMTGPNDSPKVTFRIPREALDEIDRRAKRMRISRARVILDCLAAITGHIPALVGRPPKPEKAGR